MFPKKASPQGRYEILRRETDINASAKELPHPPLTVGATLLPRTSKSPRNSKPSRHLRPKSSTPRTSSLQTTKSIASVKKTRKIIITSTPASAQCPPDHGRKNHPVAFDELDRAPVIAPHRQLSPLADEVEGTLLPPSPQILTPSNPHHTAQRYTVAARFLDGGIACGEGRQALMVIGTSKLNPWQPCYFRRPYSYTEIAHEVCHDSSAKCQILPAVIAKFCRMGCPRRIATSTLSDSNKLRPPHLSSPCGYGRSRVPFMWKNSKGTIRRIGLPHSTNEPGKIP